MINNNETAPSTAKIILAFATVYIVWGSTYFFIQRALSSFPPFILGAIRFGTAGLLMLAWGVYKGEKMFAGKKLIVPLVTGFLLLFIGNGVVIWVEQILPSAMVAIFISSGPIWFVIMDKPMWHQNLSNTTSIIGLIIGFCGVILLFYDKVGSSIGVSGNSDIVAMGLLLMASATWSAGSLYSKYRSGGNTPAVNTTWQMLGAGLVFIPCTFLNQEWQVFSIQSVSTSALLTMLYLIIFGSIIGFGAYVWLLKVQPITKVSTYAYVNPLVAVFLGVAFANETITSHQIIGLLTILASVLLINFHKYLKKEKVEKV